MKTKNITCSDNLMSTIKEAENKLYSINKPCFRNDEILYLPSFMQNMSSLGSEIRKSSPNIQICYIHCSTQ